MADKKIIESPNTLARIAAVLFLIVVTMGITLELFVLPDILVPGDAAATVNNLIASEALFRTTVFGYLIRQVFLALLALVVYKLFKPVDKNAAGLMIIFALLSTPINMLNELNYFAALLLSSGADYLTAFEADQLHAQVMFFLDLREYGTFIPQVFSFWLLLQGYLVFKSGFLPRILGILLMVGGLCYPIAAVLFFLFPNSDATLGLILGLFAFIGEVLFYLWLLIKGVNVEEWEKRALESA